MAHKLIVAWATELDAFHLGARLEAYEETKPVIEAFRLLDLKLPQEILRIIVDAVLDGAYVEKIGLWLQARMCLRATCKPRDHFTEKEMHDEFAIGCKNSGTPDDKIYDINFWEEARERHEYTTTTYLAKLTAKSNRDQMEEFGIHQEVCDHQ